MRQDKGKRGKVGRPTKHVAELFMVPRGDAAGCACPQVFF